MPTFYEFVTFLFGMELLCSLQRNKTFRNIIWKFFKHVRDFRIFICFVRILGKEILAIFVLSHIFLLKITRWCEVRKTKPKKNFHYSRAGVNSIFSKTLAWVRLGDQHTALQLAFVTIKTKKDILMLLYEIAKFISKFEKSHTSCFLFIIIFQKSFQNWKF